MCLALLYCIVRSTRMQSVIVQCVCCKLEQVDCGLRGLVLVLVTGELGNQRHTHLVDQLGSATADGPCVCQSSRQECLHGIALVTDSTHYVVNCIYSYPVLILQLQEWLQDTRDGSRHQCQWHMGGNGALIFHNVIVSPHPPSPACAQEFNHLLDQTDPGNQGNIGKFMTGDVIQVLGLFHPPSIRDLFSGP